MTAVTSLDLYVSDLEFRPEDFASLLDMTFERLFQLMARVEHSDSKLKILHLLNSLIKSMGERVRPYTHKLIILSSTLWNQTQLGESGFMKTGILRNLEVLVQVLGDNLDFQSTLAPVIEYSINSQETDYLLEDGLTLWLTTLSNTNVLSNPLLALLPNIPKILSKSYEFLVLALKILEAYVLLGGIEFLKTNYQPIVDLEEQLIGDVKDEGTLLVLAVLEELIVLLPSDAIGCLEGCCKKILSLFLSNQETIRVKVCYASAFCRLLLHHPNFLIAFLEAMNSQKVISQDLFLVLLPSFLEKVDSMSEQRRRKSAILALLQLITIPRFIQNRDLLEFFICLVIRAIGVAMDEEVGDGPEWIVRPEPTTINNSSLYPVEGRVASLKEREWRMLYKSDVTSHLTTRIFLTQQLKQLEFMNKNIFDCLLAGIPRSVLEQLK
eukprot:TRINITY_DN8339_c0_g2_i3.p1 TRINITY_DN8339_c0_g2~~TRINITY_DN8339_c0_g2_i3.p1  ORF type:complete len:438 (+),score=99.93 TRINITY_DN8339_c0_g2_i3:234-1547(+)